MNVLSCKIQRPIAGKFLILFVACVCSASVVADSPNYKPRTVIRHPFPAIANARLVEADQVNDSIVTENELVLGVEVDGEAKAYPINMICGPQREIINDTLGGRAIAATW